MIPKITWRPNGGLDDPCALTSDLAAPPYLEAVALAHPQTAHPHVGQQHLAAGVGDEVTVFGSYSQPQAGGVTPVLQLVGQQLHGHLLVVFVRLVQQLVGQLPELSAQRERTPSGWSVETAGGCS